LFAAIVAAEGWLMPAISWTLIGLIWACNLVWLVVMDLVKYALFELLERRWSMAFDPFGGLPARRTAFHEWSVRSSAAGRQR
jgi:hypothetical protein